MTTIDELRKRIDEELRRGLSGLVGGSMPLGKEAMQAAVQQVRARMTAAALALRPEQVDLLAHEVGNALAPTQLVLDDLRAFAEQKGTTKIGAEDLAAAREGVRRVIALLEALMERR